MNTLRIFTSENPISREDFEDFFTLMKVSFPKSERRTKKAFWELCQNCPLYKIYSLFSEDKLIAFFTVWEFENFTFGDHFAVNPKMRNGGIGTALLSEVEKNSRSPFIIEAELPQEEMAKRRLNFYLRNGFFVGDFDYMLPPMQKGCEAVPMRILAYPNKITETEFLPIKEEIYKTVYNV